MVETEEQAMAKALELPRECAQSICNGRYMIITHGGARADVADYVFPRIIEVLVE